MATKKIGPYVDRAKQILLDKFGDDDAGLGYNDDIPPDVDERGAGRVRVAIAEDGVWVAVWVWVSDEEVR